MIGWVWYECGAEREMLRHDPKFREAIERIEAAIRSGSVTVAAFSQAMRTQAEAIREAARPVDTGQFASITISNPPPVREEVLDVPVSLDLESSHARTKTLGPDVPRNEGNGVLISELLGDGPYLEGRIDRAIDRIDDALGTDNEGGNAGPDDGRGDD